MGLLSSIKKLFPINREHTDTQSDFSGERDISLSPSEIQFLKYTSGHNTDLSTFSKKFNYDFGLNYERTINLLLRYGYIRIGNADESLIIYTTQDLKSFLSAKGLPTSGKKEALINRIRTETNDYDAYFSKRIFVLTEKGNTIIDRYDESQTSALKDKIKYTISCIRKGNTDQIVSLYESAPDSKKPLSLGYDRNNIIKDVECIDQYRIMGHDTDRELSICIISTMYHKSFKDTTELLKKLGYFDIENSEIHIAYTSICTLKSLMDFKEAGIKKYRVSTCNDGRVCSNCAKHNNKIYQVLKAEPRKNAPPLCDECRCIIRPVFDNK
nr:minor capsid protein [uncultured Schaedlerella sp.]